MEAVLDYFRFSFYPTSSIQSVCQTSFHSLFDRAQNMTAITSTSTSWQSHRHGPSMDSEISYFEPSSTSTHDSWVYCSAFVVSIANSVAVWIFRQLGKSTNTGQNLSKDCILREFSKHKFREALLWTGTASCSLSKTDKTSFDTAICQWCHNITTNPSTKFTSAAKVETIWYSFSQYSFDRQCCRFGARQRPAKFQLGNRSNSSCNVQS